MEQIHTGKVAFITGAGAGIGLSAAQAFARWGAAVVLADSNDKSATKEADSLVAQGFKVMAVRCDVSNENEVRDAVQKGVSEFGRIDFAFNNAGVHVPVAETADVLTEDFDRIMSINLRGVF